MKKHVKLFESYHEADYTIIAGPFKDVIDIKKYAEENYTMGQSLNIISFEKDDSSDLYVLKSNVSEDGNIYKDWFINKDGYFYQVD